MISVVLVASIALAVVLGYKTKINTGFFCIAFAYLIGCFALGMKTKELIACWPTSTMFVILSVSLFSILQPSTEPLKKCPLPCFMHAGAFRDSFPLPFSSWQ